MDAIEVGLTAALVLLACALLAHLLIHHRGS